LWDTGPHQDPTRKKDKKRVVRPKKETTDEQTDKQSWDRKKTKNGKSAKWQIRKINRSADRQSADLQMLGHLI
jgi:hypothetical protein